MKIFILVWLQLVCIAGYCQNKQSYPISIETIKKQLNEIECKYIASVSFDQRRDAMEKMNELYDMLKIVFDIKAPSHTGNDFNRQYVMTDEVFRLFMQELEKSWPDEKKFKIYLKYIAMYKITINQLITVSSLIKFDSDKIEAITLLYPAVIDKHHTAKLFIEVNDKETLIKSLK
jgi:flagellin-specific chaperone FliS